VDPDGDEIMPFVAFYNMSKVEGKLGNSTKENISDAGCYITTFANIKNSMVFVNTTYGYTYSSVSNFVYMINNDKSLFAKNSGDLVNREISMDAIFGKEKWDYFTKGGQADKGGLLARLKELDTRDIRYMIAGIFDLSSVNPKIPNHMVGITGLPDDDGVFASSNIVPTSRGDRCRLYDPVQQQAYNIDNLKEIRVIILE
jgi:hypothetical protein